MDRKRKSRDNKTSDHRT